MTTLDAVVLGGGTGSRFSAGKSEKSLPKQFRTLGTAPVFIHAIRSLMAMDCFRQIVLAMPHEFVGLTSELVDEYLPTQSKTLIRIISGGERRQDSSYLALEAVEQLSPLATRVLIHDACRPYLSPAFCDRIKRCLLDRSLDAWIPIVPTVDTLKKVEAGRVVETIDRSRVFRVQTPQIFEYPVIRSLAEKVKALPELAFTDDASLCEYYDIPVGTFEGDVHNIKLTYEFELETLRAMWEESRKKGSNQPCAPESATTYTA